MLNIVTTTLVLMASLQDKLSKPVSHLLEYQTIQDFAAATD